MGVVHGDRAAVRLPGDRRADVPIAGAACQPGDDAVIMVRPTSAPPPPITFKADHPFLFMVRHNVTGSILFMGRVNDPRGK